VTGFDSVTADKWTDCMEHVKRVEAGMWRADKIQDDIEPLIIKIGVNSSCSDDSADSDQGMNGEDRPLHGRYSTFSLIQKVNC
jgi:hypothetical protein